MIITQEEFFKKLGNKKIILIGTDENQNINKEISKEKFVSFLDVRDSKINYFEHNNIFWRVSSQVGGLNAVFRMEE